METLAALGHGFAVAITPFNLFWALIGVTLVLSANAISRRWVGTSLW